jgi:hypothetical protein
MNTLVSSFMGDTESTEVAILQPEPLGMTDEEAKRAAKRLDKQLLGELANVLETLRQILATQAYKPLGFPNFKAYLQDRCANRPAFNINYDKFISLCHHDEVCNRLIDAGKNKYAIGNLLPAHTDVFYAELPETLWGDAFDLLLEEKAATNLKGKAAQYDHMFKFTAEMVKTACARVNQRITSELPADPFNDSPRQIEAIPAVFDATDDGRIVVDAALVVDAPEWVRPPALIDAPAVPTAGPRRIAELDQKPQLPEVIQKNGLSVFADMEKPEEICLAFMSVEPHEMDADVLWVTGTDGPNVYTIPVRKSVLRGMV